MTLTTVLQIAFQMPFWEKHTLITCEYETGMAALEIRCQLVLNESDVPMYQNVPNKKQQFWLFNKYMDK